MIRHHGFLRNRGRLGVPPSLSSTVRVPPELLSRNHQRAVSSKRTGVSETERIDETAKAINLNDEESHQNHEKQKSSGEDGSGGPHSSDPPRLNQLQNWINRRMPDESKNEPPSRLPATRNGRNQWRISHAQDQSRVSSTTKFVSFVPNPETGTLDVQLNIKPKKRSTVITFGSPDNKGEVVHKSAPRGLLAHAKANARGSSIEDLLGTYGKTSRRVQNKTPVDTFDGLDISSSRFLEQTERASIPIDLSLRQKLLSVYKDVPVASTEEGDIDESLYTTALQKLRIPEQNLPKRRDTSGFHNKLPPAVVRSLVDRPGQSIQANMSRETWQSLSSQEIEIILEHMLATSVVANTSVLIHLITEKTVVPTRRILECLLAAAGSRGLIDLVKELLNISAKASLHMGPGHLLTAYRIQCRVNPKLLEEVHKLVPEIAKTGFDERTYGHLIHIYNDARRMDLAIALFNNHEKFITTYPLQSTFIHNALMWTLREGSMAEEAEYVFRAMKTQPDIPSPDAEIYGNVAQVYMKRPDYFRKLLLLVKEYLGSGLNFNNDLFGALMNACGTAGRLSAVLSIFSQLLAKPDLRPTKVMLADYLGSLMLVRLPPSPENDIAIGVPMYERPQFDPETLVESDMVLSGASPDYDPSKIQTEVLAEEENTPVPKHSQMDPQHEMYHIPTAPFTPSTTGELLALADLQYQHILKYHPQIVTKNNQRVFLRLFISQGHYETFKKAYRWLALSTGLRGRQSMFPYLQKSRVSFADFARGVDPERSIDPNERYEFDYLHHPLTELEIFPAMRAAFETRDLEFARHAISDYDQIVLEEGHAQRVQQRVKEGWALASEATIINTLAQCGDIQGAVRRFEAAINSIVWDADRPRLFAKKIAVFTGILLRARMTQMSEAVFNKLQSIEWKHTSGRPISA